MNRWISFEFNTFGALYSNPMVLLKFYSRPRSAVIGQYLAHMSTIGELTPEGTEKRGSISNKKTSSCIPEIAQTSNLSRVSRIHCALATGQFVYALIKRLDHCFEVDGGLLG